MDWSKLRDALELESSIGKMLDPESKIRKVLESESEPTKSKVFGSYNTVESVWGDLEDDDNSKRKPKEDRAVEKDKLDVTKECEECGKRIKNAKKALLCKCKVLLFCSHSCLASSDHFESCQERMKPVKMSLETLAKAAEGQNFSPSTRRLEEKLDTLKIKRPGDIRRLAEAGNPLAAYMIGCSYSLRTATVVEGNETKSALSFMMSPEDLKKSVGETDEEAIKWFLIAAKGGMAEGMYSLASKLWADNGLKIDSRVAFYWGAKAWETGEAEEGCWDMLEEKGLLAIELRGTLASLEQLSAMMGQACQTSVAGPHLGALLLATRHDKLRKWGRSTPLGSPLFGSSWLSQIFDVIDASQIKPRYHSGRVGTGTESTKMCLSKERSIANTRFCQGERDRSCMDLEQVNLYDQESEPAKQRSEYEVFCVHLDQLASLPVGQCLDCKEDARQRSISVAQGLYSISTTEAIPGYGYSARYTTDQGKIVAEIFKGYSKPEIRCLLQCLSSNIADLHPLFLAEDQNLYWPLIWFFGTVYDALLECCGKKFVKKIYGKLRKYRSDNIAASNLPAGSPAPDVLDAFPDSAVSEVRICCGNEKCPKLDHTEKFKVCTGCRVRRFCSEECLRKDWAGKHKLECKNMKKNLPEVD